MRQQDQFRQWRDILDAVLTVTKAGATSGDLARAAIAANGGQKPWLPHFYLGHGIGTNAAEMPMIGTDLGEEFDDSFVFPAGMVLVLEPVVWEDGTGGYRSEEIVVITEDGYMPLTDYPYYAVRLRMSTEILPDERALRLGRRERALAQMEAHDLDVLVLGRQANVRYVSGAPQLWVAGTRPFGPICVVVRATGEIHLNSTWDEGIPEEIPHDHLYGLAWNPMTLIEVLKGIEGATTARRVGTDACHTVVRASCCRWPSPTPSSSTANSPCAPRGGSRQPRRSPRCAGRCGWPRRPWPPRWPNCGRASPSMR